jgi:hypothetical protein
LSAIFKNKNKLYVLEAICFRLQVKWLQLRTVGGSFRNVEFVLNIGDIEDVLVIVDDVAHVKP